MQNDAMITIPNVRLDVDELLTVIRHLDEPTRAQVARALAETQMDADLARLIENLAAKRPVDEISDADIQAEIAAVRQRRS
jgi:hypothetical protein